MNGHFPLSDVVLDIEDGGELTVTWRGIQATRKGLATGLVDVGPAALIAAIQGRGVPQRGVSSYPGIPGLLCSRVTARHVPGSPTVAELLIEYGTEEVDVAVFNMPADDDGEPHFELATTVEAVETNFDVLGQPLIVSHRHSSDLVEEQVATARAMVPMRIMRYYRRERSNPGQRAREYVGKTNSNPILGDGPRYWLCTLLNGETDDGGFTWNVSYVFQRHPDTWDAHVHYVGADGRLPTNHVIGGDVRVYRLYDEADFEKLNLRL